MSDEYQTDSRRMLARLRTAMAEEATQNEIHLIQEIGDLNV